MPRITISETDETILNSSDIAANVVYIPGMSSKTESNPKLYRTVKSFIEDFGDTPYKFLSDEHYGPVSYSKDEYEKSYIYAIELLTAGLPVIYHNIHKMTGTNDLAAFYTKLSGISKETPNEISLNEATVSCGSYSKIDTDYVIGKNSTYKLIKGKKYNYVEGLVPYLQADTNLGLAAGNRVAFEFNFGFETGNNAPEITGQVIVSVEGGTSHTYSASDALEPTSKHLVSIINVKTGSRINITVDLKQDNREIKETYSFNLSSAIMDTQSGLNSEYSALNPILDKWTYNIKFITAGGYPILPFENIIKTMLTAATVRGDSVALLDNNVLVNNETIINVFDNINNIDPADTDYMLSSNINNLQFTLNENRVSELILKYGSVIAPNAIYTLHATNLVDIQDVMLPGSFGYLLSLINSVTTLKNQDYLAIAGVTRGLVPHIVSLEKETTGAQSDYIQVRDADTICINPIIAVQNYGYCIWGNRTLLPNPEKDLAASSFLNIRILSSDVKKVIYNACKDLTFETNSIELWLKFRSKVEPLLEQMIANDGLEKYDLQRLSSSNKATLSVYVKLYTLYAVEDFNVTINLTDSTVEAIQ